MTKHECVSFLLINNDKVLLEKRSTYKESDPGLIAIPGGHLEKGENQQQALVREIKEELSVDLLNHYYLCSLYHPTTELQLIHYYVVCSWAGDINPLEADEVFWNSIDATAVDTPADKVALGEYLRLKDEKRIKS